MIDWSKIQRILNMVKKEVLELKASNHAGEALQISMLRRYFSGTAEMVITSRSPVTAMAKFWMLRRGVVSCGKI
jgi:hypothetical protein